MPLCNIQIDTLADSSLSLRVPIWESLAELKSRIFAEWAVHPCQQQLVCGLERPLDQEEVGMLAHSGSLSLVMLKIKAFKIVGAKLAHHADDDSHSDLEGELPRHAGSLAARLLDREMSELYGDYFMCTQTSSEHLEYRQWHGDVTLRWSPCHWQFLGPSGELLVSEDSSESCHCPSAVTGWLLPERWDASEQCRRPQWPVLLDFHWLP
jgi:hypothetical protein